MTDPRGLVKMSARGKEYRLWLGASVLAELQAKHGHDVFNQVEKPKDAPESWAPNLRIVVDLFLGALQRYHAEEADDYLVDELLIENENAFGALMAGSSAPEDKQSGNRKARRAAKAA